MNHETDKWRFYYRNYACHKEKLLYLWVDMHLHIHALGWHEKLMTMKRFFAFFLVPVLSFAVCSNAPVVGLREDLSAPYFNPEIVKIGERCADIILKQVYGK